MASTPAPGPSHACQRWFFFSTPIHVFLGVMIPLGGMMAVIALAPEFSPWIRVPAAVMVVFSLIGLYRGYGHRVEVGPQGVRYRSLGRTLTIAWADVRRIGRYVPLDRNLSTQYVYVTRLDAPPVDRREIDEDTIQLQDRPGLLESLEAEWPGPDAPRRPRADGPAPLTPLSGP